MMLSSCVHEHLDDGDGTDPTDIEATIKLQTVPGLTRAAYSPGKGLAYVCFIVQIFKDEIKGAPVYTKRIGVAKGDGGEAQTELKVPLHSGKYKVVAWAMGTSSPDSPGTGFNADDLSAITFPGAYEGSTENKECYEARFDMDLSDMGWYGKKVFTQQLTPPMGGVEVISTDAEMFLAQVASRAGSDDFSSYSIRWDYGLYFPMGYNAYTGMPNKAETGVGFLSAITRKNAEEASLGFDYIFVNGSKTQVTLSLSVVENKTGNVISTYGGIPVPLERGKITIIRGKFLTTNHDSGIGINPDFDGEINVVLPD